MKKIESLGLVDSGEMLLHHLAAWKPWSVLVVGDFMLDQTVHGAAERISPDAPVPVFAIDGRTPSVDTPGGSGNVGIFSRALEGRVHCVGVTGADAEGRLLKKVLHDAGCDVSGLVEDTARPTTVKRSLVGLAQHRHPQKMFRIDIEDRSPISRAIEDALLAMVKARVPDVDVVCLEDYGKGVCTPRLCAGVIEICRMHGKPVLVDPAPISDYTRYRGATAVTPNRSEAERATGMHVHGDGVIDASVDMATALRDRLDLDASIVTLDRHGAVIALRDGDMVHVPTVARQVYDVTGAGDMVLSALAGAVAQGMDWRAAAAFSNVAAGLEVEVFGIRPIPLGEIRAQVLRQVRGHTGKVRSREDLAVELAAHRAAGHRIVLTNGCFDVIHAGHVAYLREARSLGDVLVVGMNTDEQVRAQKGEGRPIFRERERLEILGELACVDYISVFPEPTAHALIEAVHPHVYVKGGDYSPDKVAEAQLVKRLGIEFRTLTHRPGTSSTGVIERVRETFMSGGQR